MMLGDGFQLICVYRKLDVVGSYSPKQHYLVKCRLFYKMSLDKSLQTGTKIKLNGPTTNTIIVTVRHILHKKNKNKNKSPTRVKYTPGDKKGSCTRQSYVSLLEAV